MAVHVHPQPVVDRCIALANRGYSRGRIAREVSLSRNAVIGLLFRRGIRPPLRMVKIKSSRTGRPRKVAPAAKNREGRARCQSPGDRHRPDCDRAGRGVPGARRRSVQISDRGLRSGSGLLCRANRWIGAPVLLHTPPHNQHSAFRTIELKPPAATAATPTLSAAATVSTMNLPPIGNLLAAAAAAAMS
jgi:hypothetical protein